MSVFNLGNAIMGSGILGLSYAMANTGIALFVWVSLVTDGAEDYSPQWYIQPEAQRLWSITDQISLSDQVILI